MRVRDRMLPPFLLVVAAMGCPVWVTAQTTTNAPPEPMMPSLAACLTRNPELLKRRCNQLVCDAAVSESPEKGAGYARPDGEVFPHRPGTGVAGAEYTGDTRPLAGSRTAEAGIPAGAPDWVYLDAWYIVGPFVSPDRAKIDHRFAPEIAKAGTGRVQVSDLGIRLPAESPREGAASWAHVKSESVVVSPPRPSAWATWYAYAEVYSPTNQEVLCLFGSDDWGKAWINGKLCYASGKTPCPWIPDRGRARVEFRRGYNPVFFKLENAWGRTGFSVCIHAREVKR